MKIGAYPPQALTFASIKMRMQKFSIRRDNFCTAKNDDAKVVVVCLQLLYYFNENGVGPPQALTFASMKMRVQKFSIRRDNFCTAKNDDAKVMVVGLQLLHYCLI